MALSPADVAALDRNAEALGVPVAELMENAGAAVARVITAHYPKGLVVVFAGPGNNGGDGAVAARVLHENGRPVKLLQACGRDEVRSQVARDALDAAEEEGVPVLPFSDVHLDDLLEEADLAVDALLGVGARGALRSPMDRIVAALNDHELSVVSVDLPTGHGTSTPLYATLTVTFHDRKEGMIDDVCGTIVVADIGIPADAVRYVGPGDLATRYPRTAASSRKGNMGRILVVGGGGPYTGAPVLSGFGAFATGTDLVHMALPGAAADVARMRLLEAIVHPLEGPRLASSHVKAVVPLLAECDVLLMGPGLGRDPDTLAAVRTLVDAAHRGGKRMVLDADALSAFPDAKTILATSAVVTPHAGEFRQLSGQDVSELDTHARVEALQAWLGDAPLTVLLKGPEDVIVGGRQVSLNRMHHAVMTSAGTGDVLAGVVAALLGRGLSPFDAARVGAYLNGAAGVAAHQERGYGVRASDVVSAIPAVLRDHLDA